MSQATGTHHSPRYTATEGPLLPVPRQKKTMLVSPHCQARGHPRIERRLPLQKPGLEGARRRKATGQGWCLTRTISTKAQRCSAPAGRGAVGRPWTALLYPVLPRRRPKARRPACPRQPLRRGRLPVLRDGSSPACGHRSWIPSPRHWADLDPH
eukprot:scaffold135_cov249-Pinguiococcus_pyrenoidosus.AAC.8